MKRIYFSLMFVASCLMILSSCEKDPKSSGDYDYAAAQDQSFAENTMEDVDKIADQACDDMWLSTYLDNANVTMSNSGSTKTVTVDFGATEVTCIDGKRRKGKIMITFTGNYRDVNTVHTITFENYFVNDYKVEGTRTLTNTGKNGSNQTVYSISASITINNPNGKSMTWNSSRTRTWVAGEGTSYTTHSDAGVTDDVYDITGSAEGTSFDGKGFTATVTEPCRIIGTCRWFVQGKVEFTPEGKSTRIIDYGDGMEDNYATVTINGVQYVVMIS